MRGRREVRRFHRFPVEDSDVQQPGPAARPATPRGESPNLPIPLHSFQSITVMPESIQFNLIKYIIRTIAGKQSSLNSSKKSES